MIKIPIYSKTKLLLAFELGVILTETAHKMNIEVTTEMMKRAEEIITKEFSSKNSTKLSTEMIPTILAIIEPKEL